jgi:hypothetical protein
MKYKYQPAGLAEIYQFNEYYIITKGNVLHSNEKY